MIERCGVGAWFGMSHPTARALARSVDRSVQPDLGITPSRDPLDSPPATARQRTLRNTPSEVGISHAHQPDWSPHRPMHPERWRCGRLWRKLSVVRAYVTWPSCASSRSSRTAGPIFPDSGAGGGVKLKQHGFGQHPGARLTGVTAHQLETDVCTPRCEGQVL